MSYDFDIYAARARLPTMEHLRAELRTLNPPIELDDEIGGVEHMSGFVPVLRGAAATGFDVLVTPVGQDDVDDYMSDSLGGEVEPAHLEMLQSSDVLIGLSAKTAVEIDAARAFGETITRLCSGYLLDPQKGTTLRSPSSPDGVAP